MTVEEKKDLKKLLDYIKLEILNSKKSPPMLKKKINELALDENENFVYTYKMILYSFMINKQKIEYALRTKSFQTERHKINYIMVIVSNSMNDIKNKVLLKEKQKGKNEDDIVKAQYLNGNNVLYGSQRYIKKSKDVLNKELEGLW